jgi:hypothetical protein
LGGASLADRALRGDFSGEGARATLYERYLGAKLRKEHAELEALQALIAAYEEAGVPAERMYTERLTWTRH